MKRRNFFTTAIGTAAITAVYGKTRVTDRSKGFKANAGEGRIHGHIHLKGINENILDVKVSGTDTNGDLAIFEQTSLSPKRGTPLHVHHSQDEVFYVLKGQYYFQVGEDRYTLGEGESIFLPRKIPHSWVQLSEQGKMIVTLQPAGHLEDFFVQVAALREMPTPEQMAKLFEANGMSLIGPPVAIPKM